MTYLIEETVEVDVDDISVGGVKQYVLPVPVAQPQYVAHHTHHRRRPRVRQPRVVPTGVGEGCKMRIDNGRVKKEMKVKLYFFRMLWQPDEDDRLHMICV